MDWHRLDGSIVHNNEMGVLTISMILTGGFVGNWLEIFLSSFRYLRRRMCYHIWRCCGLPWCTRADILFEVGPWQCRFSTHGFFHRPLTFLYHKIDRLQRPVANYVYRILLGAVNLLIFLVPCL